MTGIVDNGTGGLTITAKDTMVGEDIEVDVDLVVLAAGMVPNASDGEAIRLLEDAKVTLVEGDSDAKKEAAAKAIEELGHHEGRRF